MLEARAIHTGRSAYHHLLAMAQTNGIARSRVDEVIGLVGLERVARKRVGGFSLGMGQRLSIAAALLGDPPILILDAGKRPRPRRHPLDPHPAQGPRTRGPHGLSVLAPDERNGADRRSFDRGRTRAADRRCLESHAQAPKPLTIVFVVDGLRPDSVNPTDTPNLWRMENEGVRFANSHSIVPTVTRGNATVIGTGVFPTRSGILGNAMYAPELDRSIATSDANQLTALDAASGGNLIFVKSIGERLQAAGLQLASMGSGTSGATLRTSCASS